MIPAQEELFSVREHMQNVHDDSQYGRIIGSFYSFIIKYIILLKNNKNTNLWK